MKLEWAMLANHAETLSGLAYVSGGGIDTVNVPSLPAQFVGAIAIRFGLHPSEIDRQHVIEMRIVAEDGETVITLNGQLQPVARNPDMPIGWFYPAVLSFNIAGLRLPRVGQYSVDILADGVHVASLPLRVKLIEQAPG